MESRVPIAYTIGPIDSAKDPRAAFAYVEKQLASIGHKVINPVANEKEKVGLEVEDSVKHLRNLWRTGRTEEFVEQMKRIWYADLRAVRQADYLVLHFEEGDSGGGTFLEMTVASIQALLSLVKESCSDSERASLRCAKFALNEAGLDRKPVYWVCTGPTSDINTTLKFLVHISGGRAFDTYKALIEFLTERYGKFNLEVKNAESSKVSNL